MFNKKVYKIHDLICSIYDYLYRIIFFNKNSILVHEDEKFERLLISRLDSIDILNKVLQKLMVRDFDEDNDSAHWMIIAALSRRKNIKRILEIGTYNGEFTAILSELFPKSEIITVDLPENDPILRNSYDRASDEKYDNFLQTQNENIQHSKNIEFVLSNSFFLKEKVQGKFDLIWVDGGHNYPEISWDLCNSYDLLNKGGILMCDDIIKMELDYSRGLVSTDSFRVMNYMNQRVDSNVIYFLKRFDGKRYARKKNRKYIAYLEK